MCVYNQQYKHMCASRLESSHLPWWQPQLSIFTLKWSLSFFLAIFHCINQANWPRNFQGFSCLCLSPHHTHAQLYMGSEDLNSVHVCEASALTTGPSSQLTFMVLSSSFITDILVFFFFFSRQVTSLLFLGHAKFILILATFVLIPPLLWNINLSNAWLSYSFFRILLTNYLKGAFLNYLCKIDNFHAHRHPCSHLFLPLLSDTLHIFNFFSNRL